MKKQLSIVMIALSVILVIAVVYVLRQPESVTSIPESSESELSDTGAFEATETYSGSDAEGEKIIFAHQDYTRYRLQRGDVIDEGALNTERGWQDDIDATVYILNWQGSAADQVIFLRKTDSTRVTQLNMQRAEIIPSTVLLLVDDQSSSDEPEPAVNDYAAFNSDLIKVSAPLFGATVSNPIAVSGQARGQWFFEATAPVTVTNWNGLIIGAGYITAEGNWMTEEFVPFTGLINYTQPADVYSATGTLIFQNDNPSGLPEHAAAYEMTVQLQPAP